MAFMDKQGVGPCGHAGKEKGILVKVFTSCLANEIPAELAFSTHCVINDTNTGIVTFNAVDFRCKEIRVSQHLIGFDLTLVQCENKIDRPVPWLLGPPGRGGGLVRE